MRFAVIAAVIAASGCVTLHSGTTQRIRVASTPPDAQVFLDGQLVGATPLDVTVSRRNRRPVLVVEKGGFPRHERRLRRSETWRITGIFLLAACSNMVLLLLTRGAEQAHELAVRRALGASRRDLVRPLAAELLVLVGAGGLAALVALRWVEPVLSALPRLAPLGAATTAPGTDAALWTLAVAGATWAAVCRPAAPRVSTPPPRFAASELHGRTRG